MLEDIIAWLPNYQEQVKLIRERALISGWRKSHDVLMRSLSYVYADMLQFCHDSCQIFLSKHQGFKYKACLISGQVWKPFDQRFSKVLDRLQTHKDVFQSSLNLIYSQDLLTHFTFMEEEIRSNEARQKQDQSREYKQSIEQRMRDVKQWIGAPNWMNRLEEAQQRRTGDSGKWLLRSEAYREWLSQTVLPASKSASSYSNFLAITGKPGYGKTVLSSHLIEDLELHCSKQTNSDMAGDNCKVVYFHFNRSDPRIRSHIAALRSIAAQLLLSRPFDEAFIDVASLSMDDRKNLQTNASENAICALIRFLLGQFKHNFIVIDGLDECQTWQKLLQILRECILVSSCSIAVFTRPHLDLKTSYGESIQCLPLQGHENFNDIKKFIRPKIHDLSTTGQIAGNIPEEEIVTFLTLQAESIFLWSVLIISYLQQAGLTPKERQEIILGNVAFQGLENLFDRILEDIEARVPKAHLEKVLKVFQWVVATREFWTEESLQIALAVQETRPSNQDDYIQNFKKSLIHMCGPLIELGRDGVVRFIHISVSDYFRSPNKGDSKTALCVQINAAHCSMAQLGLAYLKHEVIHEPLSGSATTTASAESVSKKYHLLRYVAEFWSFHAAKAFEMQNDSEEFESENHGVEEIFKKKCFPTLALMLLKTTEDKLIVTVWIEACWTFKTPPSVRDLSSNISAYLELRLQRSRKQVQDLSERLARLSIDLQNLNKTWSRVLQKEPNEMWRQSIPAFTKSEFWVGTDEATVTSLQSDSTDIGSIMIASQVSSNGKEVGVIKVWPPSPINKNEGIHSQYHKFSQDLYNWRASYQIWSLDTKTQLLAFQFEVPPNYMEDNMIQSPESLSSTKEFKFPVVFSPSLRLVIILGTAMQVYQTDTYPQKYHCELNQFLDLGCQRSASYDSLLDGFDKPMYGSRHIFNSTLESYYTPYTHKKCHKWSQRQFHPNERYLAVLNGEFAPYNPSPPSWVLEKFGSTWVLDIYQNQGTPKNPFFEPIASVGIKCNNKATQSFCFHTSEPAIAICTLSRTVIWSFKEQGSSPLEVYSYPLSNMRFSNCGRFLYGSKIGPMGSQGPVILAITKHLPISLPSGDFRPITATTSSELSHPSENHLHQNLNSSITQSSDLIEFSTVQGQLQISSLRHHRDAGAIIYQTLCADGTMTNSTITRIPELSSLEKCYSTIVPAENDATHRLVLNIAVQESYSLKQGADFQLPAVIDRLKSTIPVHICRSSPLNIIASDLGTKRLWNECDDLYDSEQALVKRPREV